MKITETIPLQQISEPPIAGVPREARMAGLLHHYRAQYAVTELDDGLLRVTVRSPAGKVSAIVNPIGNTAAVFCIVRQLCRQLAKAE